MYYSAAGSHFMLGLESSCARLRFAVWGWNFYVCSRLNDLNIHELPSLPLLFIVVTVVVSVATTCFCWCWCCFYCLLWWQCQRMKWIPSFSYFSSNFRLFSCISFGFFFYFFILFFLIFIFRSLYSFILFSHHL